QVAHRHIRTFLPLILRDPPCTTLFPYTTLFRSIFDCLQLEIKSSKTEVYQKTVTDKTDFRYLANARKEPTFHFDSYTQVFHEKHGYLSNLSVLDLLFNEGTSAVNYLENQYKYL